MKLKDFLLKLERDPALLDRYRKANRGQRKKLVVDEGVSDVAAQALVTGDLATVGEIVREEEPSATLLCVVMLD